MFHFVKGTAPVTLETALTAIQHGWVTIEQLRQANAWRLKQTPRIGKLALNCGKLTRAEVLTVLAKQRSIGKPFGETAIELGMLNQAAVYELLLHQAMRIPTLSDSLVTLGFISKAQADVAAHNEAAIELAVAQENELDPVVLN